MIHSNLHELGSNTTPFSFVAFERSMEGGLKPPTSEGKLWAQVQVQNGRTTGIGNIKGLEGVGARLH